MSEWVEEVTEGDEVGEAAPDDDSAGEGDEAAVAVGEAVDRNWSGTTSTAVPSDRGSSSASWWAAEPGVE
jgi:hypothetical protein